MLAEYCCKMIWLGWSVPRSSMGCLLQLALTLPGASRLLTEGGSCFSEVAVLGTFAASSVDEAGGGLEEAAPCSHFLISIFLCFEVQSDSCLTANAPPRHQPHLLSSFLFMHGTMQFTMIVGECTTWYSKQCLKQWVFNFTQSKQKHASHFSATTMDFVSWNDKWYHQI